MEKSHPRSDNNVVLSSCQLQSTGRHFRYCSFKPWVFLSFFLSFFLYPTFLKLSPPPIAPIPQPNKLFSVISVHILLVQNFGFFKDLFAASIIRFEGTRLLEKDYKAWPWLEKCFSFQKNGGQYSNFTVVQLCLQKPNWQLDQLHHTWMYDSCSLFGSIN